MPLRDPRQRRKELETLLVIVLGLLLWSWVERRHVSYRNGLMCCAVAVASAGLAIPPARRAIHRAWMGLSRAMGAVTGRVLLTIVYILVLLPLSALARWRGKLSIRQKPGGITYFKSRDHIYTKEDILHPW